MRMHRHDLSRIASVYTSALESTGNLNHRTASGRPRQAEAPGRAYRDCEPEIRLGVTIYIVFWSAQLH
jgi:hypothetical protein